MLTARVDTKALTAREVVAMGRMPYTGFGGRLSLADREIAAEALALTGVASLADREVGSLSDGERQRVMIAKALAQQTPAILLDEPTAFLDFPGKVAILRLLCDLAEKHGKTILLSTHADRAGWPKMAVSGVFFTPRECGSTCRPFVLKWND